MRKAIFTLFLTVLGLTGHAQIGIGTSTPDNSAALDVNSSTRGLLPPRMNHSQMNGIASPAEGLVVYCVDCDPKGIYYYDGADFLNTVTGIVYIPGVVSATGRTWMDSNLGASQVATSFDDGASYGDLYQWGRAADGHEQRSSATTTILATTSDPDLGNEWDGMFIIDNTLPKDWLTTQDDSLWQESSCFYGFYGANNPCPIGYRVPTKFEWEEELLSWTVRRDNYREAAFSSALKLPSGGIRSDSDGSKVNVNSVGCYWSSTVNFDNVYDNVYLLQVSQYSYSFGSYSRVSGASVRCIKD